MPAPSLKIDSTSLVALKLASTVEAVVLVKLEVVTAVPCRAKVLAVTVPLIAGSDAIVTLLPTVTVPEMGGREPTVTVPLTGKFVADMVSGRSVSREVMKFSPARPRL